MLAFLLLNHVAAAEQQQRRFELHLFRANDGRASGSLIDAGQSVAHHQLAKLLNEAIVAAQVVIAGGRRRLETDFDLLAVWQEVAQ